MEETGYKDTHTAVPRQNPGKGEGGGGRHVIFKEIERREQRKSDGLQLSVK